MYFSNFHIEANSFCSELILNEDESIVIFSIRYSVFCIWNTFFIKYINAAQTTAIVNHIAYNPLNFWGFLGIMNNIVNIIRISIQKFNKRKKNESNRLL